MGISFLLAYHKWTKNPKALEMAEKTLVAMKRGGIYDQLGGGLCRYSTDHEWLVPHFEKMLYGIKCYKKREFILMSQLLTLVPPDHSIFY